MSRLNGRKALVTGAASGIGAATVARLLADGATVLACDISGEGMAGTFNHVANLADPQAIALLAAAAESQLGGLDILVNNAGVCPVGTLEDLTDDQWQFGLDVNLLAPARLAKACLPLLKASPAGRVINTGSILSRYGDAGLGAYAAPAAGGLLIGATMEAGVADPEVQAEVAAGLARTAATVFPGLAGRPWTAAAGVRAASWAAGMSAWAVGSARSWTRFPAAASGRPVWPSTMTAPTGTSPRPAAASAWRSASSMGLGSGLLILPTLPMGAGAVKRRLAHRREDAGPATTPPDGR